MILEYLFSSPKSVKDDIKIYAEKDNSIKIEIKDINESEIWLVTFKVNSEDEQSALTLSEINEAITGKYDVTTLTNEAAAYYNKMLYPLINKFERNLRKILYLASKISENSSYLDAIKNLETMDFGKLFDLIFIDRDFIECVKKTVKKSGSYSKDEIINDLKEIEENTLWKNLLSVEVAPMLQKNYIEIRNYRNNVMHAHNIATKDYLNAKNIYSTVIEQLENAIDDLMNNKVDFINIQNFNSAILKAINSGKLNDLIAAKIAYGQQTELLMNSLDIPAMNIFREHADRTMNMLDTPAMNAFREQTEQIKNMLDTPAMNAFKEQTEIYLLIYNDIFDIKNNLPATIKSNVYEEQGFELSIVVNAFQKLLDSKIATGSIDQNKNLYIESFQD